MQLKPEEISKLIKEQIKHYENRIAQDDTGTTIMIGVEEPRLDEVLDILKRRAGQRKATVYQSFSIPMGHPYPPLMPATPVVQDVGGVVVFVMDLQHMEKF